MCEHRRDGCVILHRYSDSVRPERPIICANGKPIAIVSIVVKILCSCGHITLDRIRMVPEEEETA